MDTSQQKRCDICEFWKKSNDVIADVLNDKYEIVEQLFIGDCKESPAKKTTQGNDCCGKFRLKENNLQETNHADRQFYG